MTLGDRPNLSRPLGAAARRRPLHAAMLVAIALCACGGGGGGATAATAAPTAAPTPVSTPTPTPTAAPTPTPIAGLLIAHAMVGTFKGTWADPRFAPAGGEVSFTFAVDDAAKTITASLTLTGPALGGAGAGTENYPAAAMNLSDPTKLSFTAPSPKFGTINVSVDTSGHFVADLPQFPAGRCTFSGTSDGTGINGTADVTLTDGSKAGGPLMMKKQ